MTTATNGGSPFPRRAPARSAAASGASSASAAAACTARAASARAATPTWSAGSATSARASASTPQPGCFSLPRLLLGLPRRPGPRGRLTDELNVGGPPRVPPRALSLDMKRRQYIFASHRARVKVCTRKCPSRCKWLRRKLRRLSGSSVGGRGRAAGQAPARGSRLHFT